MSTQGKTKEASVCLEREEIVLRSEGGNTNIILRVPKSSSPAIRWYDCIETLGFWAVTAPPCSFRHAVVGVSAPSLVPRTRRFREKIVHNDAISPASKLDIACDIVVIGHVLQRLERTEPDALYIDFETTRHVVSGQYIGRPLPCRYTAG